MRVHIELPDRIDFSADFKLSDEHINQGGHLDSVQLLQLVSKSRCLFFRGLGYTESVVEGVSPLVSDQAVKYCSEAHHGEVMRVQMTAAFLHKYGFHLVFRMIEKDTQREVARGKVGIIFIDPSSRKVAIVPSKFLEKLADLEQVPVNY